MKPSLAWIAAAGATTTLLTGCVAHQPAATTAGTAAAQGVLTVSSTAEACTVSSIWSGRRAPTIAAVVPEGIVKDTSSRIDNQPSASRTRRERCSTIIMLMDQPFQTLKGPWRGISRTR